MAPKTSSSEQREDLDRQDPDLKRARQNRSFARQVKKRLNKWHTATGTPACVLFLRGGAVLCEGPAYLKNNFGKDKQVQSAFIRTVFHHENVIRNANEEESSPTVTLPPKGRDVTVYDLRNIVTSCVTMGNEGYTNPHWGKPEYKPCWWPDEIPYLAPKSGKSKLGKKQLMEIMESYRAFFNGDGMNAHAADASVPENDLPTSSVVDDAADDPSGAENSQLLQSAPSSVIDESSTHTSVPENSQSPQPTSSLVPRSRPTTLASIEDAASQIKSLLVRASDDYDGQGRQLILLLNKVVSLFDWEDVTKIAMICKDCLPSFRRNKKFSVSKDMIDIKYRFVVESNDLQNVEPLKSTGDGNCLFNSISILVTQTEELAALLRVLSFLYATLNLGQLEQWLSERYEFSDTDSIAAFFCAYYSGPMPSKENLSVKKCLIDEAKKTLELNLYAGYLQVVFVAGALQSTVNQYAIKLWTSPVSEEFTKPVTPPGSKDKLQLDILWVPKEFNADETAINHVIPLIKGTPSMFNTNSKTMDTCAADEFCQKYHDGQHLANDSCSEEVECEFCLQWFHIECLVFNPVEITGNKEKRVNCGCHLSDLWGTTLENDIKNATFFVSLLNITNHTTVKTLIRDMAAHKVTSKRASMFPKHVLGPANKELVKQVGNFLKESYRITFSDELFKVVVVPEILVWTLSEHKKISRNTAEMLINN